MTDEDVPNCDDRLELDIAAELEGLDKLVADIDDIDGGLVPPEPPPPQALSSNKTPHTEINRNHIKPPTSIAIPHPKKMFRLSIQRQ